MNPKEQVFLNSCELILQQFSTKLKNSVYFLWRKGKKHIQSLKYQCNQDITPMKQTLSLSLKTYSVNGQMQKRYTHFSVFDADGRQLDHVNFDITEWKPELTQKKIVLGQCNLKIRIRRRVALQLQNFHRHSKTEIQESSQHSGNEVENVKLQKKEQLTIKEQLAKSRRELQDYEFLTSKLKNDRNFYITENENLRHKLGSIHQEYSQQISMLKEHYQTRLQIRESIYEQEIQQLISTFNQNYEINRALIQGLVHEKYDYEAEINEMKEMHQSYINKQQDNYQSIISQLQHNKKEIEDEIKDLLNKINDKQSTITELQKDLEETKILFQETKDQLNKQIEQHGKDNQKWEKQLQDRQLTIYKRNQQIQAMNIQIDTKEFQLKENQAAMEHYRTLISQFEKSIVQKEKINHQIETQRYNLTVEIQRLKVTIQEQTNQIQFHRASIQQLKQQDKIKQEEYLSQYRSLQAIYNEKQVMFTNQLKMEHQKFLEVNKQNYQLNIKIQQLQHEMSLLNDQVTIQKNDNQQNMQLATQLRQEMKQQSQAFTKQYREYNQQIADLMSQNNVFQAENISLKEENRELQRKIQIDTAHLKKDYEDLMDSKVRLYQDQLQFLKRQRDSDVQNFERLKKQYEIQITSLLDRESKQNQEMQRMFRDEMDMKNKEFVQIKENYTIMKETYDDLKLRLQITEEERNQLKKQLSSGKRPKMQYGRESMEIQEIEEESQQVSEQQESQSEESESSSDHRKKNKKKKTTKQKQKEKEKKKKNQEKKKKEQKKVKQKQKAKKKTKKNKKRKQTSSQSEQQSQQESEISDQQLSEEDPSQILANIEDDSVFINKQKNLVRANDMQGGSQKMIPIDNDMESIQQNEKQKSNLPQLISIQVPMDEPYNNDRKQTNKKEARSVSSMKKRKDLSEEQKSRDNDKVLNAQDQIRELQKQIKKLKKQIKQHQRTETVHLSQIEQLEDQVKLLNTQIDNLVKKVSKKDPKLAKNISAEIEQKRSQKSISNRSRSQVSLKMPPIPRKQVENMKMENQYLKRTVEQKNKILANVQNEKNNLLLRLQSLQGNVSQIDKRTGNTQVMIPTSPQYILSSNQQGTGSQNQQTLKRTIIQMQSKLMSEREKCQQSRLQLTKTEYEKEQTQKQNKKLKSRLSQIEEQIKKNQPTQSQREMQKQLEDYGKQFLQMSKSMNSAKIQKQAFQEQLRLVKKRYAQIIRASQQAETKASNLQRQVQDLRRKEGKARRDMQEYQDEVKKNKEIIKNLHQQINQNSTLQTQNLYQRKKLTDQIMKLEDNVSNKQFETNKMKKQIEKLKQKIQQGDDLKVNKRNDLLQQKQRLQGLLIKAEKKNQQFQDQETHLKQKVQMLQRQNRKSMQQKKSTYGDKLRFYVQEISHIKQIVDEYENENSRLKIQNSEFFQHNQILKLSFQKLEIKYEQLMESQEKLLQQLDAMQRDIDTLNQQISQNKLQIQASTITSNNLRKQLDSQRTVSKKKSDKLTAYQQVNEKYLYELKSLKIKLSQFETNINQNELLTQNIQKSTKTIQQLQYQLKKLQQEYHHVINTYTYRKQDVQQAMKQLKIHEEKIKQQEITRIIEQLDSSYSQKHASMEQQIIQLFNQNAKLRLTLHQKTQENAENNLRITELQPLAQRLKSTQRQSDNYQRQVYQLTEQLKNTTEQLRRTQSKLNESIRNQQGKTTENVILTKKLQDIEKKYKEIMLSCQDLKKQQKKLNERVKLIQQQRRAQVQKLTSQTLHYQNKILALELQVGRMKQMQDSSSKDYAIKVRKLEEKIDQMSDTYKEHEQTLEAHFAKQTKKLEMSMHKLSEQLEVKMQRIQELNEALIMLQQQNEDIVAELTNSRTQLSEQNEIYTQNVNILRNQLKQAEDIYDQNIKILQEEMSMLSKQLNTLKYNRSSTQSGTQRLTHSAVQEDQSGGKLYQSKARRSQQDIKRQDDGNNLRRYDQIAIRRFEQKIRIRDKRIQQLKCEILLKQDQLGKFIRKDNNEQNGLQVQIQRLKGIIQQKVRYFEQASSNYQGQLMMAGESMKLLKKQLLQTRQRLEEKEIIIQGNVLQLQSLRVQLRTTKELYSQLQNELQKRKKNFNNKIQQDSHWQAQYRININKINTLNQKLQQLTQSKSIIQTQLKKKTIQLKRLTQNIDELNINYNDICNKHEKKTIQVNNIREVQQKTNQTNDRLTQQSKRLTYQLTQKDKLIKQLQAQIQLQSIQINHNTFVRSQDNHHKEDIYAQKYQQLTSLIRQQFNITLQEYCAPEYLNQRLNQKDQDIQILAEQLQQLRFLIEHKNMELDELKKNIYQLQINNNQNQYYQSKIQQLQQLCQKLEEDKKDAIFRQQALKLQLENIIQSEDRNNITIKLQNILQMSVEI